jgi:hypothetical protein
MTTQPPRVQYVGDTRANIDYHHGQRRQCARVAGRQGRGPGEIIHIAGSADAPR